MAAFEGPFHCFYRGDSASQLFFGVTPPATTQKRWIDGFEVIVEAIPRADLLLCRISLEDAHLRHFWLANLVGEGIVAVDLASVLVAYEFLGLCGETGPANSRPTYRAFEVSPFDGLVSQGCLP